MELIKRNINEIFAACRKYEVKSLAVFGSILTDRFNKDSDVDFLVNFKDSVNYDSYSDNFFGLYYHLKDIFNREVDLVDEKTLKNRFFIEELNETKQPIYG